MRINGDVLQRKVPPIYREIMRANVFCVKLSSRVMSFDEQKENYNLCLKQTPTTSSLDIAIMRSRHVMAGDKAAKELWGVPKRRDRTRGTTLADDTLELEGVLFVANVFVCHTPTPMDTNYFLKLIGAKENVGSARDHDKTTVPLTEHERGVIGRLTGGESEHDDDDNESTVSNDESICPNRTEGVVVDNNSNSDGDEDLTKGKCAK